MKGYNTFTSQKARDKVATILALLAPRKRRSCDEIAAALDLTGSATREYLRYLRGTATHAPHERVVRIAAWRQLPGTTQVVPLYGLGSSRDAPRPMMAKGQRPPLHFQLSTTQAKLTRIRAALEAGPLTAADMEDEKQKIFLSRRRITDSLRYLRGVHPLAPGKEREVYISGWRKNADPLARRSPVYSLGNLPDVPEPKKSRAQMKVDAKRRRQRAMKDPAKREAMRAENRTNRLLREGKIDRLMPEPMALLFGRRKPFDMEYFAAERPNPPIMLQLLVRNLMLTPRQVPRRQFQ